MDQDNTTWTVARTPGVMRETRVVKNLERLQAATRGSQNRVVAPASKGAVINCSCAICERQLSGLASLLCRSSDSLGEFRSDECAAPVKLLEDEVQHVFLGRHFRVWQKVPPERHAFLVCDNHFTYAWVLHGRAFASEAKIPRSDPGRGYCPVDSASVIIKRGDVTP